MFSSSAVFFKSIVPVSAATENPLSEIKTAFLESTADLRPAALAKHTDHVVVYAHGRLSVWRVDEDGKSVQVMEEAEIPSFRYNLNKTLSHIPITIFNYLEGIKNPLVLQLKLRQFFKKIHDFMDFIKTHISASEYETYVHFLQPFMNLLKDIIQSGKVTGENLERLNFLTEQAQAIIKEKFIPETSQDLVSTLLKQFEYFDQKYNFNWEKTDILIVVPAGAKNKNVESEAVATYMAKRAVSISKMHQIVFHPALGLPPTPQTLILRELADIKAQETIGKRFLGDKRSMKSDVLSGAHVAPIVMKATAHLEVKERRCPVPKL